MDHAEVLALIEDAVAAPGGLGRLGSDPSPVAVAVREHLAACPACTAEWRAWSVVSLGLAAAAPDVLEPRPGLREQVLAAAAARPRSTSTTPATAQTPPAPAVAAVVGPGHVPASTSGPAHSGITLGPRRARRGTPGPTQAARASSGPPFRWLLLGAAAVVVLFVAGIGLGRTLVGTQQAPGRGDPGRVLSEAAAILEGSGFSLARLETPEGDAGGVVVVSPGTGRMAVVSSVLAEPPEGTRYLCLLDRSGTQTRVGYMHWEPTSDGDGLAYWAGDAVPADLGTAGDVFIVQLDTPGSQPALTGVFQG